MEIISDSDKRLRRICSGAGERKVIQNVGESIGEEYTVEWKDAEPGMTESEKK